MRDLEEMEKELKSEEYSPGRGHDSARQHQISDLQEAHRSSRHTSTTAAAQRLRRKFFEARLHLINRDDAVEHLKSEIMSLREREDELLELLDDIWQQRKQDAQQIPRFELPDKIEESPGPKKKNSVISRSANAPPISEEIGHDLLKTRPAELPEPLKRPSGPTPEEQQRRANKVTDEQESWAHFGKGNQQVQQSADPDRTSPRGTSSNLRRTIRGSEPPAIILDKRDHFAVWPAGSENDNQPIRESILKVKVSNTSMAKRLCTPAASQESQPVKPKRVSFSPPEAIITGRHSLSGFDPENKEKIRIGSTRLGGARKPAARPMASARSLRAPCHW